MQTLKYGNKAIKANQFIQHNKKQFYQKAIDESDRRKDFNCFLKEQSDFAERIIRGSLFHTVGP